MAGAEDWPCYEEAVLLCGDLFEKTRHWRCTRCGNDDSFWSACLEFELLLEVVRGTLAERVMEDLRQGLRCIDRCLSKLKVVLISLMKADGGQACRLRRRIGGWMKWFAEVAYIYLQSAEGPRMRQRKQESRAIVMEWRREHPVSRMEEDERSTEVATRYVAQRYWRVCQWMDRIRRAGSSEGRRKRRQARGRAQGRCGPAHTGLIEMRKDRLTKDETGKREREKERKSLMTKEERRREEKRGTVEDLDLSARGGPP